MTGQFKIIDLTHSLSNNIPSWDGKADFELSIVTDYKDCTPPDLFRTQKINASVSLGTHMDAPAHVIPGGRTIDKLTLEELVVNCVVIDGKIITRNKEMKPINNKEEVKQKDPNKFYLPKID